jgi:hypothetical protein
MPAMKGCPRSERGLSQIAVHESVGELLRDVLAGDQHPVVDGPDELVGRKVDVRGLAQLAAAAGAQERLAVALSLRCNEVGFGPGRDRRVMLRLPGEGAADGARVGGGQERGDLAEVIAEVAAEVPVVGRGKVLVRVGEQGIE